MSNVKLKAGQVARFRVTPKDCQSTVALLKEVGVNTRGMSFNQCVSLAFSALMETARSSGLLEEPDPYQFLNDMAPFNGHFNQRRKLEVSAAIGGIGEKFKSPSLINTPTMGLRLSPPPSEAAETPPTAEETPATDEVVAARQKLTQLLQKKDRYENAGIVWTDSDEAEFQRVYKVVYPYG